MNGERSGAWQGLPTSHKARMNRTRREHEGRITHERSKPKPNQTKTAVIASDRKFTSFLISLLVYSPRSDRKFTSFLISLLVYSPRSDRKFTSFLISLLVRSGQQERRLHIIMHAVQVWVPVVGVGSTGRHVEANHGIGAGGGVSSSITGNLRSLDMTLWKSASFKRDHMMDGTFWNSAKWSGLDIYRAMASDVSTRNTIVFAPYSPYATMVSPFSMWHKL
ncbi:hypothetical protein FIBSPDRAFT_883201 [Athelia psychrophila]|uniref:Uncharacterized protein n=1 Tax=Athelia psychrophila TaxID=1759441 RepID=A0A166U7S7_9AGAM|nr:hypothetical protein FIBSPDRAFT_883201 [Fibularhizoctonia sp. CBS 109695]